ncbi:MAG TPA: Stk1 family PASTA domain-containing Ser/Thr kinase [Actinomycetota bacterium]|jgi:serine/threonine-protein kinase
MAETKVLGDRYELTSMLGHGGMAEVYLGTDRVLGRQVAVKILGNQFVDDESFVARFRREAQSAAALNHPNVVSVFDTGSDDGTHFIVMEYVQGKTLADVIKEDAPLLPERAVEIAEAVAAALGFAHREGIIHRDVKPGNIMLTPTGDVKVMDFGIARAVSSDSLTQTATVLGTATYFSPEQAQGASVDARSDIYSVGVVLYEMLTAHPPFAADSPVTVAYKHVKEDPTPPSRLNADVSPQLDAIVMKCLAKNPVNRYQSAAELQQDLERFRSGQTVQATPLLPVEATQVVERDTRATTVLPAETTPEVGKPRRWVAAVVLLLILGALGLALFFLARSLLSSPLEEVPDVIGQPLSSAQLTLRNNGFVPGRVIRGFSNQPEGAVFKYQPTRARQGATITLYVSQGPQTAIVPKVICLSLTEARQTLKGAGLQMDQSGTQESADCSTPGLVSTQDPKPGEKVNRDDTVFVTTVPTSSPSPSPSSNPPPSSSPPSSNPPPSSPPPSGGSPPPSSPPPSGGSPSP